MKSKSNERPVLVTTVHRGVFFGYATETNGTTIDLSTAAVPKPRYRCEDCRNKRHVFKPE